MERDPKRRKKGEDRKGPSGGRALERVRQFAESRGLRVAGTKRTSSSHAEKKSAAKPGPKK